MVQVNVLELKKTVDELKRRAGMEDEEDPKTAKYALKQIAPSVATAAKDLGKEVATAWQDATP